MTKLFFTIPTLLLLTSPLISNERKFSYIYETSVLPVGVRELEIWNTYRSGKTDYFRRLDQRIEFEVGLPNNLQTSFYLNFEHQAFQWKEWVPKDSTYNELQGIMQKDLTVSVSNEWKYKLADRVADPFGCAVYGEATIGLDEDELEAKLLFDKQLGNTLFAFNLVAENEWETGIENNEPETESELKTEIDLGLSHSFSSSFAAGIEIRNANVTVSGIVAASSLFAGPVISYSAENWWATFTFFPQVMSFKVKTQGALDLAEYEKIESRLLFSFHL